MLLGDLKTEKYRSTETLMLFPNYVPSESSQFLAAIWESCSTGPVAFNGRLQGNAFQ